MKASPSSSEFQLIFKNSKSLYIDDLLIKYLPMKKATLGFIVSRTYGHAVLRNQFKRRCRSLFKNLFIKNNITIGLIVIPKKKNISFKKLSNVFNKIYTNVIN